MLSLSSYQVFLKDSPLVLIPSLEVLSGETYAILGKNGSGKSSFALSLLGHPRYTVKAEKAEFLGKNLLSLLPHERALLGMFLVFQNPREISGISLLDFYVEVVQKHFLYKKNITLRQALSHSEYKEEISRVAIVQKILKWFQDLELDASFLKRDVFSGFSGGEKKKLELITLLLIKPSFIFLDELDSGLDAHSVILCSQILRQYQKETGAGILLITHLEKIMEFLPPQKKYIFKDGTCLLQQ